MRETPGRILPGMLPPSADTGFMIAARPRGWVRNGDHWGLWWGNRQIASVQPSAQGIRVDLSCRKLWQDKRVRAASVSQGKRYAERWCAARLYLAMPLREAVVSLTDNTLTKPGLPRPGLPSTKEQQRQAERLDAAAAAGSAQVTAAQEAGRLSLLKGPSQQVGP